MNNTLMLYLLLATPLLFSVLAFLCCFVGKQKIVKVVSAINSVGVAALLMISFLVALQVHQNGAITSSGLWLHVDVLSALFLVILGIIGFITGIYSVGYMNHEVHEGEVSEKTLCVYYGFFHLFIFTMLIAITTNNLIVMWAAIEATTLTSTFLVGLYGQKSSLEAAWKYIIICTVGVAFGLYGTVLVYANAANVMHDPSMAIFWTEVVKHPTLLDPTLMHLAFVFVLLGFGTKMGLFPMHAWLPDAHSEAPSPVSALLSAVLLNCALLVIIRYYIIISGSIGDIFPRNLLLVFGFLSVIVAAFLLIVQRDMKRLLAYSSVENMGLIAIALGIGGPIGVFAALLHTLNHSLAKTLLFCGSGNVLLKYGTRDICTVKGLLKIAPITAILLGGGALALAGMPPFNVFVSEFMIVVASIKGGYFWFTVLLLVMLTIVLGGLVRMVAKISYGQAPEGIAKGELGFLTTAPMAILLVLMLIMGTSIPKPVSDFFTKAVGIVLNEIQSNDSVTLTAVHSGILYPKTGESVVNNSIPKKDLALQQGSLK